MFAALNNPHLGSESACRQPGNVRLSETQVNCATISGVVSSKEREETLNKAMGLLRALEIAENQLGEGVRSEE